MWVENRHLVSDLRGGCWVTSLDFELSGVLGFSFVPKN